MLENSAVINKKYHQFFDFAHDNVICVFSSRYFENMSLFYGNTKDSLNNRRNFLQELGIDYQDLVCAKQVHGNRIKYVKEIDKGRGALVYDDSFPDTDAFITDRRRLPLAIFTADCLSIFLYDPKTPAIGLIHAGWRSSKGEIAAKTIQSMKEIFGTSMQDLHVGFGPAIRKCCYEVRDEFIGLFPYGLIQREGLYYLDLLGINKRQILNSGVKEKNIFDFGFCNFCRNEDFFSFRKERESCGRIISVAMLA